MKQHFKKAAFGLGLFAFVLGNLAQGSNAAQETITLNEALTEAEAHSPDLQRARAATSESEWSAREALGAGFLPKVSAGAHHYFDEKYTFTSLNFGGQTLTFPGFYPTDAATVDVQMPIFDGLANIRNVQAADLAKQAAHAQLSHQAFELRENVRLAFYRALAAEQLQAVAVENVRTLEDHLKQTDIQKQGGVATNYDILRVQVQLSEARSEALDAADNVAITRKKLTQLLGLENDTRPVRGDLPAPDAARVQKLEFSEVPKDRADIEALNLRAEAANRSRQAGETWLVPSISLQGEYMLYNQQFYNTSVQDTGDYKSAYSVGVFLNWNLFDGGVAIARAQEAVYRQTQAEKAAESLKLQVPYDFEYWKRRYVSNTDHYLAKQLDVKRSQESVRLSKEEEKAGTRTSTETLDAELDLFRSRAGVVNALINSLEAEVQLDLALGREI
jgi:outer membrane protein TolC